MDIGELLNLDKETLLETKQEVSKEKNRLASQLKKLGDYPGLSPLKKRQAREIMEAIDEKDRILHRIEQADKYKLLVGLAEGFGQFSPKFLAEYLATQGKNYATVKTVAFEGGEYRLRIEEFRSTRS